MEICNRYPRSGSVSRPLGLIYTPSNGRTIIPEAETGGCVVTWRDGTIRDKIWVGVTKGIVDGGKLRAIYSDRTPDVSLTSEQFYTAAQATGTGRGPH